ncbi:MAG: hypothetical protein Q9174_007365, partial [Haloplaca sp. 1 TL-2023]
LLGIPPNSKETNIVEEQNRIRRNVEGFEPTTLKKRGTDEQEEENPTPPEVERFFGFVMELEDPKPRNIAKNIKIFEWKCLVPALEKVFAKYVAVYSSPPSSTLSSISSLGPALPSSSSTRSFYGPTSQPDRHHLSPNNSMVSAPPQYPNSPYTLSGSPNSASECSSNGTLQQTSPNISHRASMLPQQSHVLHHPQPLVPTASALYALPGASMGYPSYHGGYDASSISSMAGSWDFPAPYSDPGSQAHAGAEQRKPSISQL